MNHELILPIFQTANFDFDSAPVPKHIEAQPLMPNYTDLYGVVCISNSGLGERLAMTLDIEDLGLAKLLARARAERQYRTPSRYGCDNDVYIMEPDGKMVRTYVGRR